MKQTKWHHTEISEEGLVQTRIQLNICWKLSVKPFFYHFQNKADLQGRMFQVQQLCPVDN